MKIFIIILLVAIITPAMAIAEQNRAYSGVSFANADPVVIDVDYSYSMMIYISFDAPHSGYVAFDYSFFTETEIYCLQLLLGEVRGEGETPDESPGTSYVTNWVPDCPTRWNQVMPVGAGMNYYGLAVKSCARDGEVSNDQKTEVTFRNVNISATFIPEYLGPIGKEK